MLRPGSTSEQARRPRVDTETEKNIIDTENVSCIDKLCFK